MYCRTGAPCGVASVGSGAVEEGMVVVEPVFVAVAAWSGGREAARDVVEGGWFGVGLGTGGVMRGAAAAAAGEGAVVGVVEGGGCCCCACWSGGWMEGEGLIFGSL
jgi:hypothetical protein